MASGGYIEQADIELVPRCLDDTMPPDGGVFGRWRNAAEQFNSALAERTFFSAAEVVERMANAGFVDIKEARFLLPLGAWSSDPYFQNIGDVSLDHGQATVPVLTICGRNTKHIGYLGCMAGL